MQQFKMKHLTILALALALGCIGGQNETTTTTAATNPTTTSIATTSTETAGTTTTAQPVTPAECDSLNATFWRALCYDGRAYETQDPGLCRTVYCKARLLGAGYCGEIRSDAEDWIGYKRTACEAWANRRPFMCDGIMKSGDCLRWYALLGNDIAFCQKAENTALDDCLAEFSFWRGNQSLCRNYKTNERILPCEAEYYLMEAVDTSDDGYCAGIKVPKTISDCHQLTKTLRTDKKHPLYGLEKQLI